MFSMFLKIGIRNLLKNKVYSAINIAGLSIGLAVSIIIGVWILDEFKFNEYHTKKGTVAHVFTTQTFNGHTGTGPAVSLP